MYTLNGPGANRVQSLFGIAGETARSFAFFEDLSRIRKVMTASPKEDNEFFTFKDYLKWEAENEEKHEYFGGEVFAMAGASDAHDLVAVNILSALHQHMKSKGCRVHSADMKLKVSLKHGDASYYPDAMIVCDPADSNRNFKTKPKVIVEVMSNFRRDHIEKFMVYQTIDSLEEYVVIDQDSDPEEQKGWIYRRERGWEQEVVKPGEMLHIPSIEFSIDLATLYEA